MTNTTKLPKNLKFTRSGQQLSGIVTRISAEVQLQDGRRVFKTLTDEDLCPTEPALAPTDDSQAQVMVETPTWTIMQKFDFMANLIRMVIDDVTCSLVITGSGGLGKTSSVFEALKRASLTADRDFVVLKGYTTPRGFYEYLYRNNGRLIIVDDCDAVFKTQTGVNILKAALDSFEDRTVSWQSRERAASSEDEEGDDSVPNSFEFSGRIIFISNLSHDDVPQPVRSRSMNIDLTMNVQERLDRINYLMPVLASNEEVTMDQAKECFDLIVANQSLIKDINIRTAIMTLRIRKTNSDVIWKDMATFQLLHN